MFKSVFIIFVVFNFCAGADSFSYVIGNLPGYTLLIIVLLSVLNTISPYHTLAFAIFWIYVAFALTGTRLSLYHVVLFQFYAYQKCYYKLSVRLFILPRCSGLHNFLYLNDMAIMSIFLYYILQPLLPDHSNNLSTSL